MDCFFYRRKKYYVHIHAYKTVTSHSSPPKLLCDSFISSRPACTVQNSSGSAVKSAHKVKQAPAHLSNRNHRHHPFQPHFQLHTPKQNRIRIDNLR